MTHKHLVLSVGLLVGVAAVVCSHTAGAYADSNRITACSTATENAGGVLSPNAVDVVVGGPWAKESCDALVAGIAVTKDSAQAPAGYESRFTVAGTLDAKANISLPKDKCSTLHQHVFVYKGANSLSLEGGLTQHWTFVGGGGYHGVWHDGLGGGCRAEQDAGFTAIPSSFTPPTGGTDFYRVAVAAHLDGKQLPVTAVARHLPKAPR